MNWRFLVAWRYFRTRRRDKFISVISVISVLGVAVGVAALITVLAVMSGFDRELKARIIGTTPHIIIEGHGGITCPDAFLENTLSANEQVTGFSPFVRGQVIVRKGELFSGVILNGIDEDTERSVTDIRRYIKTPARALGVTGVFVGSELAGELKLKTGDTVALVSAVSSEPRDFKVEGIFHTGLYNFDLSNVFVGLDAAREMFGAGRMATGMAVRIRDELKAPGVKRELAGQLGFPYFIRSWMDLNSNLFGALKLEKITMFVILTLIVIVACFNIASALIVRVVEKTGDIGILKAIGSSGGDIGAIFRLEGFFIGAIGTALGVGLGVLISWAQKAYNIVRLPRDIYYIDALPVYINWQDSLIIAVSAIFLSLAATVYPSRQAARLEIADALRYE